MSLDVYLEGPEQEVECVCACCDHKHTRKTREEFFSANITHNLNRMAEAAGTYQACWRPEDIGATKARQLIPLLQAGPEKLKADPDGFKKFDAPNGWGLYENFVPWVQKYLCACEDYPEADVTVSR